MIRRESFLDLLKKFPDDFEKFHYIKDQIIINKKFNFVKEECYSCGREDHLINSCPLLNLDIEIMDLVDKK
jgi:hypothetical protein